MPEPDGDRAGQTGTDPSLKLLILGDSSAAGVGCQTQEEALSGLLIQRFLKTHRIHWRLHARTGWTSEEAETALPELGEESFDVAVISLGVNDVTTETGVEAWLATYDRILGHLRKVNGVRHFILSGLPPMGRFPALPQPLRWYMGLQQARHQRALGTWAASLPDVTLVPLAFHSEPSEMAQDGFHPGPAIYARWADLLGKAIEDLKEPSAKSEAAIVPEQLERGA
jgi:lysophospholipase L1-like esterase